MGQLVDGKWQDQWYDTKASGGRFVREQAQFRCDGIGASDGEFAVESGRYHLYVSLACPWAHRTLIFRTLKKLEAHISVDVVDAHMGANGWEFRNSEDATVPIPGAGDSVHGFEFMHQVYTHVRPDYTGRVTVPVLYDKKTDAIVCNESSEIIRVMNSTFDELPGVDASVDFYPQELRDEIDRVNDFVYPNINNGVYRAGFATTQDAYEEGFDALFAALDKVDADLATRRYLVGDRLTEADWRLFTTLVRFDAVYVGHFKCNLRRIADYEHLSGYLRELYQMPGVAATVDMAHIKHHYYGSHGTINPTGVVPKGPALSLDAPHGRGHLPALPWRAD